MNFKLNIKPLLTYANEVFGCPATLQLLDTSTLERKFVADRLFRHDLVFRLDEGRLETLSVVQKYTSAAEVKTVQAPANMPEAEAVPHLIDSSEILDGARQEDHWFIVPLNLMYLHYAARHWVDNVPGMAERLEEAVDHMSAI